MWVALPMGQVNLTNVTNLVVQESYGIGDVAGPIVFANMTLGPHFVPNQGIEISYAFLCLNTKIVEQRSSMPPT